MNVLVITLLNVNILRNLLTFCQKLQVHAYPIIRNFNGTTINTETKFMKNA